MEMIFLESCIVIWQYAVNIALGFKHQLAADLKITHGSHFRCRIMAGERKIDRWTDREDWNLVVRLSEIRATDQWPV